MIKLALVKIEQEIEAQLKEGKPFEIIAKGNNHKLLEVTSISRVAKNIPDDGCELQMRKKIWRNN